MAKSPRMSIADRIEPDPVIAETREPVKPVTRKKDPREHQNIYAMPAVFKACRMIRAQHGVTLQDLLSEGLRRVMAEYGYNFDELNR